MDSNTIILIVGLPGSGKSYLADQINKESRGKFLVINDPKYFKQIAKSVDQDLIITDPHLCFENNRKLAIKKIKSLNPNCKIKWIFFENDPQKCLENSERRNRLNKNSKEVKSFINKFCDYYTIPDSFKPLKVFSVLIF